MILSRRALNRALLERQMLLERRRRPALGAIEHPRRHAGAGPRAPYLGLWSRLDGFQPSELSDLISSRRAVRSTLMRKKRIRQATASLP